jgi:hypothetical protein
VNLRSPEDRFFGSHGLAGAGPMSKNVFLITVTISGGFKEANVVAITLLQIP